MTKIDELNEYGRKLNQSIMKAYLYGYIEWSHSGNADSWASVCPRVLRDYVLTRQGWVKNSEDELVVIFDGNNNMIDTHYRRNESPGLLMIRVAKEIAKSELVNDWNNSRNYKKIFQIEDCVDNQDWLIPFVRIKNTNN